MTRSPSDGGSTVPSPRLFSIENLGCAKNQVDAEIMGNRLVDRGWTWAADHASADVILVNTCGFIEPAKQESIDTTLDLTARFPHARIVMTGCLAQRYAPDLAAGLPELAGVFGNRAPERVDELVTRLDDAAEPVVWRPRASSESSSGARPARRMRLSPPGSVYLKIAEGCDHRCSFCAIPAIRGGLRVRRDADILQEFDELLEDGVVEFNLVAQDLAAWRGDDGADLVWLLHRMLERSGRFWIRLLYLYPDTFPSEVLPVAAADSRVVPYFDLSFQHAAPGILRRMGRPGDAAGYLALIRDIRRQLPDVALRSSFIVGFPGETEDDLEALAAFLTAARLEWGGVFAYSREDGTPAARFSDPPPDEKTVARRRDRIQELQSAITTDRLRRFVGRRLTALVEEPFVDGDLDVAIGRLPQQAPDVDGVVVIHGAARVPAGRLVAVEITDVTGVDLQARLIPDPAPGS